MVEACSTQETHDKMQTKFWSENLKKRVHM